MSQGFCRKKTVNRYRIRYFNKQEAMSGTAETSTKMAKRGTPDKVFTCFVSGLQMTKACSIGRYKPHIFRKKNK